MDRKSMPLVLMLVAGAITCIITFIRRYSVFGKVFSLLVVLIVFYFLGSVIKWTLDYFDKQNEIKNMEEGEVIEKDSNEDTTAEQAERTDEA